MKTIPLTQGKFATVDDADFDWLNQWRWCVLRGRYVVRNRRSNGGGLILMHREIMNAPDGMTVDHIDNNGFDNRRENLRICTNAQNLRNRGKAKNNTSGFKGVSPKGNKHVAHINVDNQYFYIGIFSDPEEAAHAYDAKAKELHGEFARTNF